MSQSGQFLPEGDRDIFVVRSNLEFIHTASADRVVEFLKTRYENAVKHYAVHFVDRFPLDTSLSVSETRYGNSRIDADEFETKLVERNDPAITLGIARYGFSPVAQKRVLQTDSPVLKETVLRHSLVANWLGEHLIDAFERRRWGELDSLLLNPWAGSALSKLVKREFPFDQATETEWKGLLFVAFHNIRFGESLPSSAYSRTDYLESEHNFDKLTEKAWEVVQRAPSNRSWAYVLDGLLVRLHPRFCGLPDEETLIQLIEKWRTGLEVTDPSCESLDQILEGRRLNHFHCCGHEDPPAQIWSWAFSVRKHLADCLSCYSSPLKQSSSTVDPAVRWSYLKRVPVKSTQMLNELWEKESEREILEAIVLNESLYGPEDLRAHLGELCRQFEEANPHTKTYGSLVDAFRRETKLHSPRRTVRKRKTRNGGRQHVVLQKRIDGLRLQLGQTNEAQRLLGQKADMLVLLAVVCLALQLAFYLPAWVRAILKTFNDG